VTYRTLLLNGGLIPVIVMAGNFLAFSERGSREFDQPLHGTAALESTSAGGDRKPTIVIIVIVKAAARGAGRIAETCILSGITAMRIQGDLGKNEKWIQHEVGVQSVFVRPRN
jgi:hypothetical protein